MEDCYGRTRQGERWWSFQLFGNRNTRYVVNLLLGLDLIFIIIGIVPLLVHKLTFSSHSIPLIIKLVDLVVSESHVVHRGRFQIFGDVIKVLMGSCTPFYLIFYFGC